MVAEAYGRRYSLDTLRERMHLSREGVSLEELKVAAESIGFKCLLVETTLEELTADQPFPCIALWDRRHLVVLYKISNWRKKIYYHIADPKIAKLKLSEKDFKSHWESPSLDNKGIALLLEPTEAFYAKESEVVTGASITRNNLIGYLKFFRKLLIKLFFYLSLIMLTQLTLPVLTKSIVDIGIKSSDLGFIHLILIAQLMLFFSKTFIEFARSWILMHISLRINISILSDFFIKLLRLPISFFDNRKAGDIMQRMGDHDRIERFIAIHTLNTIFSFFSLITFTILLAYYSTKILLCFLVAASLYMFWVLSFIKRRRELDYNSFNLRSKNQNAVLQLLNGVHEIKLNNCQDEKRWEWERLQIQQYHLNVKNLNLSQTQQVGAVIINEGKNILITFLAAAGVVNGDLTLGTMLAIQYVIGQLNTPLDLVIQTILNYQDAKISMDRLNEIHLLKEETDIEGSNVSIRGKDIVFRNVSFSYRKTGPEVLRHINFTLYHGKVTAIVGASGGGKTTLLKLLMRFYEPTEGAILIGDDNINQVSYEEWRGNCGAVLQNGFLFSDSIARNISFGDTTPDIHKLERAVQIANIAEFINSLPLKFDTLIGPDGIELSQGQKQRMLIARAVYKDPRFLFFDEATNALDTTNERVIMNNLRKLFTGRTVIIVAHRLSTVKYADQILVIEKGKIIESGNHQSLIHKQAKYFSLIRDQLELDVDN
jgi:ATP-binding cassette subfamily B protein